MKASLSDGCKEWHELKLEFSNREIDLLIHGLQKLKSGQDHFHCWRDDFVGESGVYNIEISCSGDEECGEMEVQLSPPVFPDSAES